MERKIHGIIKHKSKEEIILKDQNNIEWRLTDINPIYDMKIGFSEKLGRKSFVVNCINDQIIETKAILCVNITSRIPERDEEYEGLEADLFFSNNLLPTVI